LGVQLGGINFYDSIAVEKNLIGKNIYPLEKQHIKESIKIAYASSALFIVIGVFFINLLERR
ncbi:MAG: cobalamin biosynthesis protein, partial [Candidatus Omnitrophota bacterium]